MMHFHPVPRAIDDEVSVTSFAAKAAVLVAEQMTVLWRQEYGMSDPRPPRNEAAEQSENVLDSTASAEPKTTTNRLRQHRHSSR